MNDSFDAHHQWLGIPPAEQPANYYRLLGLSLFEPNEEVIRTAAEQRQTFLRTFQQGHGAERSQQLLNEISQAKVCLLDAQKRASYDAMLQANTAPSLSGAVTEAHFINTPETTPPFNGQASPGSEISELDQEAKFPSWSRNMSGWLPAGIACSVALLLMSGTILVFWVLSQGSAPTEIASGPSSGPTPERDTFPTENDGGAENLEPNSGGDEQEPPNTQPVQPQGSLDSTEGAGSPDTEVATPRPDNGLDGKTEAPSTMGSDDSSEGSSENTFPLEPRPDQEPPAEMSPAGIAVEPSALSDARQTLAASYPWTAGDEKGKLLHLYDQMIALGEDQSQSDTTRLAALIEARSVAWAMIDIPLVARTTSNLALYQDFDLNSVELAGLQQALTQAETGEDLSKLWWLSLSLTPNLVIEHRFDDLNQLWESFEVAIRADAGRPFRKGVIDYQRLVNDWQTRFQTLPQAPAAAGSTSALTPEAHQQLGLWLLEIEFKPREALQHLSLGTDSELQRLAKNELSQSAPTPDEILSMAEDWLTYAAGLPDPENASTRGRYAFQAHAMQLLRSLAPQNFTESQRDRLKTLSESLVSDSDFSDIIGHAAPLAGVFANDLVIGPPTALPEISGEVAALSITSDGAKLAVGSDAGTNKGQLAVFDLLSKQVLLEPQEMGAAVYSIDWFPDDQRLIFAGSGNLLKNWDTRRPISKSTDACPTIPGGISLVAVGPRGRTVVGASDNGTLYFWQGNNGKLLTTIRNHRQEITSLAVSEDGSMMVTGSRDQKAQLWNEQGPLALLNDHSDRIHLADISKDGLFAAIADSSNLVTLWNTTDYQKMGEFTIENEGQLVGLHLLRHAPWILTVTDEGELGIYDLAYETWINRISLGLKQISHTALSNDGLSLVVGTSDGELYLLNLDSGLLSKTQHWSAIQSRFSRVSPQ